MLNAGDGLKALGVTKVVVGLTRGETAARTAGTREDFKVFINCIFLEMIFHLNLQFLTFNNNNNLVIKFLKCKKFGLRSKLTITE